ncbi:hypothetical protein QE152_g1988 [Popillia japonica]|uniref:Uncharacterized protein n=1 Tax=Popillia japonica TaxID=7064 RepID=A0AAW1N2E4_POPJA
MKKEIHKYLHRNLREKYHYLEIEDICTKMQEMVYYDTQEQNYKRENKLNRLIKQSRSRNQKTDEKVSENMNPPPFVFHKKITNLTNVKFKEDEESLMEKGLKYAIPPKKENLRITGIEI